MSVQIPNALQQQTTNVTSLSTKCIAAATTNAASLSTKCITATTSNAASLSTKSIAAVATASTGNLSNKCIATTANPTSLRINPLQQWQQQMPPHSVAHGMQQIVQPQLDNNSNPSTRMSTPVPHPSPQKEKEVDECLAKLEFGIETLLTYFKPTVKLTNITLTKAAPQTPSKTSPQSPVKKYTETPPKRISSPVKPISLIKIPEKNV